MVILLTTLVAPHFFAMLVAAPLLPGFFAVPDAEIPRIRSILTIVGGKVVHDAGVLRAKGGPGHHGHD